MPVYDVTIKFVNRTNKVIKNVSDFGLWEIGDECNYFYVEKNGYNIFIPRENVLYIGREFDLREE